MEFYCEGKQYRRSTGTSDSKLAQRIYDKVKGQIAEQRWFEHRPGENRTIRQMLERYLQDHSAPNKAPGTHRRDKSLVDHLMRAFGDRSLRQVRPAVLAEYKAQRRRAGGRRQNDQ